MKKVINLKHLLLIALSISLLIMIVGCKKNNSDSTVVSSVNEFNNALQNKKNTILCDNLTFDEDTIIKINYGLTIKGNNSKTTLKNVHFQIMGPNVSSESISVTFENIILDGGFYTKPIETGKTFEEIYTTERDNLRSITADWGYSSLTLKNVDITGYASGDGSALYIDNSFIDGNKTLFIDNCSFYNNISRHGTIKVFNNKLTTTILNSEFKENTVGAAGGFVISNGKATIDNCKIHDNIFFPFDDLGFEERGGGVYIGGSNAIMSNCYISNNETLRGGGIALSSALSGNDSILIKNCRIENNRAKYGAGAFITSLQGQPIDFIGCEFYGNTATDLGSVLYTLPYAHWTKKYKGGQVNILFSSIANNTAPDKDTFSFYEAEGMLGYIVIRGSIVIDDSTYENDERSYNYVNTAQGALNSGAIQDLNISTSDSIKPVKGSDADIKVPVKVYKEWHQLFNDANKDTSIGSYTLSNTKTPNKKIILIVSISLASLALVAFVTFIMIKKYKNSPSKEDLAQEDKTIPQLDEKARIQTLTEREYRIVALTMAGRTREEIATELRFSVGTIKVDLTDIYRKLGCQSRTELIIRYKDYFSE